MSTLSLTRWPTVTEPRFGYVTGKWIVPLSDGRTLRFTRQSDALAFIVTHPKPSLKTLLSASVKENCNAS